MRDETNAHDAEVSDWMRSLRTLSDTTPLPDPDVLWLRAQLEARQEAAARALWMATLRGVLRYGSVLAGAAWLIFDSATAAAPVPNVAISSAAALAIALGAAALVFGRSFVAERLRYFGLL